MCLTPGPHTMALACDTLLITQPSLSSKIFTMHTTLSLSDVPVDSTRLFPPSCLMHNPPSIESMGGSFLCLLSLSPLSASFSLFCFSCFVSLDEDSNDDLYNPPSQSQFQSQFQFSFYSSFPSRFTIYSYSMDTRLHQLRIARSKKFLYPAYRSSTPLSHFSCLVSCISLSHWVSHGSLFVDRTFSSSSS